jgi:hypothetical protein
MVKSPTRADQVALAVLIGVIAAVGWHGAHQGLSSHGDSRAILERSVPAILHGSYVPSRSLGNPLYEAVCALLYEATSAVIVINFYSMGVTIVSLLVFAKLLDPSDSMQRRILGLVGFALNPLVLVNSSAVIEWAQVTLFLVLQLMYAQKWLKNRNRGALWAYACSSAMLVLTRPDAIFICLAVFVTLLWETDWEPERASPLIRANTAAAIATMAVFVLINRGFAFLGGNAGTPDAPFRRVEIAVAGDVWAPRSPCLGSRLQGFDQRDA